MEQRQYWDQAADEKKFTTPFQAEAFERLVGPQDQILDVGCGYGRTLHELSQAGYRNLMGMDFSSKMIARGHAEFPALDLRVQESAKIDLPNESVDAVILFAVLTCIRSNEAQRALLAEIRRVLRPNGILYVNDFLLNTDERNQARYDQFAAQYGVYGVFELPEGAVCRHHDEQWIHALLADFETVNYEHLTFTTMNGHTSNGFYFLGRKAVPF